MSKNAAPQRKALGKGLSALLPSRAAEQQPVRPGSAALLSVQEIDPNPLQPRTLFQEERLRELADSIRANGIIQPLIVQRKGSRYQLIAGERRWRAAQLAGLTEVPVVVHDIPGDKLLEVALIENIQREDLNPLEVAQALERLGSEHGLSHEEIGQRTGKDRSTITNLLRLLRLPATVQALVADHKLAMGHARALLGLPDASMQMEYAGKVVNEQLSVRETERMVQRLVQPPVAPKKERSATPLEETIDPNVRAAVLELESALGTRVRIVEQTKSRGKIEIEYYSQEELDRLYLLLLREGENG